MGPAWLISLTKTAKIYLNKNKPRSSMRNPSQYRYSPACLESVGDCNDITADGNCLYTALSPTNVDYRETKKDIIEYLAKHEEMYSPFEENRLLLYQTALRYSPKYVSG